MSDSPQAPTSASDAPQPLSPWRCIAGAIVAGAISVVLYNLTTLIAQAFASRSMHYTTVAAANIAVAVRTLVIGMSALGTGIFGLAALGLLGLGIQLLLRRNQPE